MISGSLPDGESGNRREVATISAQFFMEVTKNEMDFTEKNFMQDVRVPNPPETRKAKKGVLLKKIGWKKQKKENIVRTEEVSICLIEESGSKETGVNRNASSVHMDGIGTEVPPKDAESYKSKDSRMASLITETEKNKRVKKRFWPKMLRFKMETASKKTEKEVLPIVTSEIEIKGKGNDVEGLSVSSNGGKYVAPMKNVEPSGNVDSSVNNLIPTPTKNMKKKKSSWWKKLIMKGNTSSKKVEKDVATRMSSETIANESENDVGGCNSVSSTGHVNVASNKYAKRSSNVGFPMDTLNPAPVNEKDFVGIRSASQNQTEFGKGASCSNGLNQRGRTKKKTLRNKELEIFKFLPQIAIPLKISVDGNGRELNFGFSETQSSSNLLNLQQKREICLLCHATDLRTVWLLPQTQNISSKLTPCQKRLYVDIAAFPDLFPTMLLCYESLNHAHYAIPSITQGQSNSEDCQALHRWHGMYALWFFLRILMDQIDFRRAVSTKTHTRNDVDVFQNSQMTMCHLSSISEGDKATDADSSVNGMDNFNATPIKGEESTKCAIQVQKEKSHPGDLHGCSSFKEKEHCDTTAVITQTFKMSYNTFELNIKYDKMFTRIMKTEDLGSVMWNAPKTEISAPLSQKEQAQTIIVNLSTSPSMSQEPASILQSDSGSLDPSKLSKYEKLVLPAATATSSISGTSSTSVVIQEERNFSCVSNIAASQSVSTGLSTIEGLLLNAYVQYFEKERASFMESSNALKRENEELKLINGQLQEENSNLKTLLLDKLDCDGPKGNNSKEEIAVHLTRPKNDSKEQPNMKDDILGETTIATNSKSHEEKYGQTSGFQNLETEKTHRNVKQKKKLRKKSKKRPDFVGLSPGKGVERNTGLGDTIAGVITPTKRTINAHCRKGRISLIPEENFTPVVSLDKTESVSTGSSTEVIDDVEEMICKQLSFLNENLDMNTALVLTELKNYYSLFTKKKNNSLKPLKTILRNELQMFMKHSQQVVELRNIVQDLLENNKSCEFPGELLVPRPEKEKERSSEKFLPMCQNRVHESNSGLCMTGVVEKFSPKSSCFQRTRDGELTGNTQCKDISAKPSYADIVKRNLHADCGATSKSHTTAKEETMRKSTQTEKSPTVFPLSKNRTSEGTKTYSTRIFRRNKKTPTGGSSKKHLN